MLKRSIRTVRAFIESQWTKFNAYLENEREISDRENAETAIALLAARLIQGRHPRPV